MPKRTESTEGNFYRKSIAQALHQALSDYDEPTGSHSERVGGLAGLLAAQLDLGHSDRRLVAHAGITHDIGKLGIKPAVLTKTGPLTPEERTEIQRHSAIGAEVLIGHLARSGPHGRGSPGPP